MEKRALGIDFGTSNSYFSEISGDIKPICADIKFQGDQSTVPTCVLYQKKEDTLEPLYFGQDAVDFWMDLLEDERDEYAFFSGFKPDIAHSSQAYEHTVAFFQCIREYFRKEGLDYFDLSAKREIVVGIPAKNLHGQEEKTRQAFAAVGLPNTILVPEPQGALFYHLFFDRQKITLEKAHQGVVVVDFGGGTLDVAYLQNGKVKDTWGNPLLGGRLFDDLFFQWFLEKQDNPDLLNEIKEDGNLEPLTHFTFRHLKEKFSQSWDRGNLSRFRSRITMGADYDYGIFKGISLEEFYEKARHYKMSSQLQKRLQVLDDPMIQAAEKGETIDLLEKIRSEILSPQLEGDVAIVILTGGGARWPFMKEIVQDIFPGADVFRSNDPEATISRGLGIRVFIDHRTETIAAQLRQNKEVLKDKLWGEILGVYENFIEKVGHKFTQDFFQAQVQPALVEWKQNGGSVKALKEKTKNLADSYFTNEAKQTIDHYIGLLDQEVRNKINRRIEIWLHENEVEHIEYLDMPVSFEKDVPAESGVDHILEDFFSFLSLGLTGFFGIIAGSIMGGAGTALLISGPIGWIIGFILGAVASFVTIANIEVEEFNIPAWVLKMIVSNDKIEETRKKFFQSICTKMSDSFAEVTPKMQEQLSLEVDVLVRNVEKSLSVVAIIKE